MRRQIMKKTSSLLVAGLLVAGMTFGVTAYAATSDTGAAGASSDTKYTLEKMLVYAIEDEHLAQAEYDLIMDTYGTQRPFSNIIKAEATHISLLEPLFEEYKVQVPDKDWESLVTAPASLEAAYAVGVKAEEKNIAMYEKFLKEKLPDDVRGVFEKLMNASEKHLTSFQRHVDGVTCGNGNYNGKGNCNGIGNYNGAGNCSGGDCNGTGTCDGTGFGNQAGKGNGRMGGHGNRTFQGNQCNTQENCVIEQP